VGLYFSFKSVSSVVGFQNRKKLWVNSIMLSSKKLLLVLALFLLLLTSVLHCADIYDEVNKDIKKLLENEGKSLAKLSPNCRSYTLKVVSEREFLSDLHKSKLIREPELDKHTKEHVELYKTYCVEPEESAIAREIYESRIQAPHVERVPLLQSWLNYAKSAGFQVKKGAKEIWHYIYELPVECASAAFHRLFGEEFVERYSATLPETERESWRSRANEIVRRRYDQLKQCVPHTNFYESASNFLRSVSQKTGDQIRPVYRFFNNFMDSITNGIESRYEKTKHTISDTAGSVANGLRHFMDSALHRTKDTAQDIYSSSTEKVSEAKEKFTDFTGKAKENIGDLYEKSYETLHDLKERAKEKGERWGGSIKEGFEDTLSGAYDKASEAKKKTEVVAKRWYLRGYGRIKTLIGKVLGFFRRPFTSEKTTTGAISSEEETRTAWSILDTLLLILLLPFLLMLPLLIGREILLGSAAASTLITRQELQATNPLHTNLGSLEQLEYEINLAKIHLNNVVSMESSVDSRLESVYSGLKDIERLSRNALQMSEKARSKALVPREEDKIPIVREIEGKVSSS
jgi:gas vesicle protein